MPRIAFTPQLARHVEVPEQHVAGATLRACLEAVFAERKRARDYVLDEQGEVRKHVAVFVNGQLTRDLGQVLGEQDEIYVMQGLSGG